MACTNMIITPRIAIIGAGPSGLTLARLLHVSTFSIPCTVFELDPHPSYRLQGGTLDLHTETGQLALREAQLWDKFVKVFRPDSEDFLFTTKDLKHLMDERGDPTRERKVGEGVGDRPEIDRTVLRSILIESLPKDSIRWGSKVETIIQSEEEGKYSIKLSDNSIHGPYDLIVGADGAWSRVRPLIHDITPTYSGVSFLEFAHSSATVDEGVNKFVGRGSMFAFSDGKGVQSQRLGNGDIRVYTGIKHEDPAWIATLESRDDVLRLYQDWAPVLQDCIRLADKEGSEGLKTRALFHLPKDVRWRNKPGLTLMGDAAHLITPMAGEGVNTAMRDALELSRAIVKGAKTGKIQEEVTSFEESMFVRAKLAAEETEVNLNALFSAEYPDNMGPVFRMMGTPSGGVLRIVWMGYCLVMDTVEGLAKKSRWLMGSK